MSGLNRAIGLVRLGLVGAMVFLWVACSDASGPAEVVQSVEVSGVAAALQPGDTVRLAAIVRSSTGQVLSGRTPTWSSADTAVAVVSASGLVTARGAGAATIIARVDGKQGSSALVVQEPPPPPVQSVVVTPTAVTVDASEVVEFEAVALDINGAPLERAITWRSTNHAVALVDPSGAVLAVAPGTAQIIATSEGREGQGTIVVRAKAVARLEPTTGGVVTLYTGDTRLLGMRAFAADGTELFDRPVTWRSANDAIARVAASGLVEARTVGNADAIAEVEGITARVSIDVRSRIARIDMIPGAIVLAPGEDAKSEVIVRGVDNDVLQRPLTWTSSNPAVASVGADGRVYAHAAGTAVIKAIAEGHEGWLDVRVVPWVTRPLQLVGDSAMPATLFTRTITDAAGVVRTSRMVAQNGTFSIALTGSNSGRYEQLFSVWILVDGQMAQHGTYSYRGTFTYDPFAHDFVLHSYAGQVQRMAFLPDGRARITGALEAGTPELRLLYGQQQ